MRIYRQVWIGGCCVFVAAGVAAAVLDLPFAVWPALAVPAILVGFALVAPGQMKDRGARAPGVSVRRAATLVTPGYLMVIAALGLASVLGSGVLLILPLLGVLSPWAVNRYRAPRRSRPEDVVVTTSELCRQWFETYDALTRATTCTARLRIVMKRQRCLDELERRDPVGLQAWLGSTASAGGDPRRYLTDTTSD